MSKREFVNWTPPEPAPGHELVFHGTSKRSARRIAREGIKTDESTADLGGEIWATRARGAETPAELEHSNYPAYIWIEAPVESDPRVVEMNRNEIVFRRDVGLDEILLVDLKYDVPGRPGAQLLSDARTNPLAGEAAWEIYQRKGKS